MHKWNLIKTSHNPYEAQMFREALFEARNQDIIGDTIFFSRPPQYVWLGYDIPLNYVDREICIKYGIPVVRSILPGGPLLHVKSFTVVIVAEARILREVKSYFHEIIIETLGGFGLEAVSRSPKKNDIFVNNKRIAALASRLRGNILLLVEMITLKFDHELAKKVLKLPATKMAGRGDIRAYVTSMEQELGREVTFEELEEALEQALAKRFDLEDAEISPELQAMTESLRDKYTSEEWIKYGKWSPVKEYWRPE